MRKIIFKWLGAGLQLKDLKQVFLTHVHPDHAGCATDLRKHADFEIYMHPIDAELAKNGISLRDTTCAGPGILNNFFIAYLSLRLRHQSNQ